MGLTQGSDSNIQLIYRILWPVRILYLDATHERCLWIKIISYMYIHDWIINEKL